MTNSIKTAFVIVAIAVCVIYVEAGNLFYKLKLNILLINYYNFKTI